MASRGFTLLETIIYIALLSVLMSGALITASDLLESSSRSNSAASVQEEGVFVDRKLEWALYGLTAAPAIGGSGCAQTLSVTKAGANNPIQLQRNSADNSVEMREGGSGSYSALTTNNVSATCLQFGVIAAVGSGPAGITATTTISGHTFVVTKYLRQ